jgi:multiple sugar transport system ATP-binding protein
VASGGRITPEPLSNLDAKLRVAMRAEIKELHERLGSP